MWWWWWEKQTFFWEMCEFSPFFFTIHMYTRTYIYTHFSSYCSRVVVVVTHIHIYIWEQPLRQQKKKKKLENTKKFRFWFDPSQKQGKKKWVHTWWNDFESKVWHPVWYDSRDESFVRGVRARSARISLSLTQFTRITCMTHNFYHCHFPVAPTRNNTTRMLRKI